MMMLFLTPVAASPLYAKAQQTLGRFSRCGIQRQPSNKLVNLIFGLPTQNINHNHGAPRL
jgi:hypothetical protein